MRPCRSNGRPAALEKGLRSERALNLALAEMYVQGLSTRKAKAVIEQLCGTSVSSTQVSRAAASWMASWRPGATDRSGAMVYLFQQFGW